MEAKTIQQMYIRRSKQYANPCCIQALTDFMIEIWSYHYLEKDLKVKQKALPYEEENQPNAS